MDFLNLVHLVVAREQWEKRKHFEEDATQAPIVHLVVVVSIGHQALGRAVPTRGDVFRERRLGVHATTTAEICQLYLVVLDQNILAKRIHYENHLRFNVPVKNTVFVHVIDCLDHLVHVIADPRFWQVVPAALDCLVHVHVHQFEDEGKATRWLVIQHLNQRDDVRVRRKTFERLDLPQVVDLKGGAWLWYLPGRYSGSGPSCT